MAPQPSRVRFDPAPVPSGPLKSRMFDALLSAHPALQYRRYDDTPRTTDDSPGTQARRAIDRLDHDEAPDGLVLPVGHYHDHTAGAASSRQVRAYAAADHPRNRSHYCNDADCPERLPGDYRVVENAADADS